MTTPGPWFITGKNAEFIESHYSSHPVICQMTGEDDKERAANARFIVTACNLHDELVEVCKALVVEQKYFEEHTEQPGMMTGNQFYSDKFMAVVYLAEQALAKATQEAPDDLR